MAAQPIAMRTLQMATQKPVALMLVLLMGCGAPTGGTCNGSLNGEPLRGLMLDPESTVTLVRPTTCAELLQSRYDVSWGARRVRLELSLRGVQAPTKLAEKTYNLPPDVPNEVEAFKIAPSRSELKGTLQLSILGIEVYRTGTLSLRFDMEWLECDFKIPPVDEGPPILCDVDI